MDYNLVDDYNYRLEPWFSPGLVIKAHTNLGKIYSKIELGDGLFKRANEMLSAALTITGALALSPLNQYILQSNNQTESPDVMVGTFDPIDEVKSALGIHRFELVEFGTHTKTDDVYNFLLQTKEADQNKLSIWRRYARLNRWKN